MQLKFKLPVQVPKDSPTPLLFLTSHCLLWPLHLLLTISTIWNNFLTFPDKCHILLKTFLKTLLSRGDNLQFTLIEVLAFWSWHLPPYWKLELMALVYCLLNQSFLSQHLMCFPLQKVPDKSKRIVFLERGGIILLKCLDGTIIKLLLG